MEDANRYILSTLQATNWTISGPNETAFQDEDHLQSRMKKLGISRP
jgi:hypothetical protein